MDNFKDSLPYLWKVYKYSGFKGGSLNAKMRDPILRKLYRKAYATGKYTLKQLANKAKVSATSMSHMIKGKYYAYDLK